MTGWVEVVIAPGMFSQSFMHNAWMSATMVAVVTGLVGFFVVLRGTAFVAHALPKGGFAGAAGPALVGELHSRTVGFHTLRCVGIGWLSKRGRHDVVTALALVFLLGLGDLFLNMGHAYAPAVFSLLFGEILGVDVSQVWQTCILGGLATIIMLILYRPLMMTSVAPESAQARGISTRGLNVAFLVVVAISTAVTVPIVGALLTFSLMIGPAAAAACLSYRPVGAILLSVGISVVTVWVSLFVAYDTGWPVGFFVASLAAFFYAGARLYRKKRHRHG